MLQTIIPQALLIDLHFGYIQWLKARAVWYMATVLKERLCTDSRVDIASGVRCERPHRYVPIYLSCVVVGNGKKILRNYNVTMFLRREMRQELQSGGRNC